MTALKIVVKTENFEKIEVTSQGELGEWLETNHHQEESVWLVTYKKSVPDKYVSIAEVLNELIAYGWIDGIRRKLDEHKTMQLIAPRKSQHWAKTYKDRANKLIADGKMTPAGQASIERSKKLGLSNFMDDVDALITPPDLHKALEEATRKKRIAQTAELAAKGKKIPGI